MSTDGPAAKTQPGKPRKRSRRAIVVVLVSVMVLFMLFCSGLPYPIIGGASHDLVAKLRDDFGLSLPASAVVEHGCRIAYRDPAYYYQLHIPPGDLPAFMDQIRASARKYALQEESHVQITGPPPPAWFAPQQLSDLVCFSIHIKDDHARFWVWGYSPSTGTVFVAFITF